MIAFYFGEYSGIAETNRDAIEYFRGICADIKSMCMNEISKEKAESRKSIMVKVSDKVWIGI